MINKQPIWNHLKAYAPFYVLIILFAVNAMLLWPGQMTPDSHNQYETALSGIYNDHHPPIMSALWRILDQIYTGSGLLFLLHLLMLYTATAFFMACSRVQWAQWLTLALPLMPPISLYSSLLWKDVGFACAYLLALAVTSFCIMHNKRFTWIYIISIMILLFYGTGVKFQAQYVLFIPLWGLSYCLTNYTQSIKTLIYTFLLYLLFLLGLQTFNALLVPTQHKVHSWQLVKLYDLTGISIQAQKPIFPDFILNDHAFSMDEVSKRYNHERVDDLMHPPNNPLKMGDNAQKRTTLLDTWYATICTHPYLYLKHRFAIWWRTITIKPIAHLDTLDFTNYKGLGWFRSLQQQSHQDGSQKTWMDIFFYWISIGMLTTLYLVRYLSYLAIWLPFLLGYWILGILKCRKNKAAIPLVMLSSIGIVFLGILFFCTMASQLRYVYIVFCMIHASHSFAYLCIRKTPMFSRQQT